MTKNIPKVILAPQARETLKAGFDQMAHALAVTLGPTHGIVLSSTALKSAPEPITDAATIARRITALPDRGKNVGAMLMRSLAWRVHQRCGDGSATTAILAQAILEQASRYVDAGANPVRVQAGIKQAALCAIEALKEMASPVTCQEQLASVAYTATHESEMSFILGEMFDLLGEYAHVTVENYMAPFLEREYLEGGRWQGKLVSPHLVSMPGSGKAIAHDCNVALFYGTLSKAEEVLPLIKILAQSERKNLLLVAQKISDQALNTLVATFVQNRHRLQFVLVDLVRAGEKARQDLQDLSLLTGARLLDPQSGDRLASIQPGDLGSAQRAEANEEFLLVSGGKDDPAALHEHFDALNSYLDGLVFDDKEIPEIKMRLGRLAGKMGILKIGAYTQNERDILHQKAQQGIHVLEAALKGGILPGGGTAYLHCIPFVEAMPYDDEEERMGHQAVARALRRPFEQLLQNAKIPHAGSLAHEITQAKPGLVFDTQRRKILPVEECGVLDAAQTLMVSLETASSGAQLALSTDVLVLKRKPKISYQPG
ncbi:MAG: chaperonin GroEL [Anaerolineales bacterium]